MCGILRQTIQRKSAKLSNKNPLNCPTKIRQTIQRKSAKLSNENPPNCPMKIRQTVQKILNYLVIRKVLSIFAGVVCRTK